MTNLREILSDVKNTHGYKESAQKLLDGIYSLFHHADQSNNPNTRLESTDSLRAMKEELVEALVTNPEPAKQGATQDQWPPVVPQAAKPAS